MPYPRSIQPQPTQTTHTPTKRRGSAVAGMVPPQARAPRSRQQRAADQRTQQEKNDEGFDRVVAHLVRHRRPLSEYVAGRLHALCLSVRASLSLDEQQVWEDRNDREEPPRPDGFRTPHIRCDGMPGSPPWWSFCWRCGAPSCRATPERCG